MISRSENVPFGAMLRAELRFLYPSFFTFVAPASDKGPNMRRKEAGQATWTGLGRAPSMPGPPRESYTYPHESSMSSLSFEISPGRSTPLAHLVSASAMKGTTPERLSVHFPAGKTSRSNNAVREVIACDCIEFGPGRCPGPVRSPRLRGPISPSSRRKSLGRSSPRSSCSRS